MRRYGTKLDGWRKRAKATISGLLFTTRGSFMCTQYYRKSVALIVATLVLSVTSASLATAGVASPRCGSEPSANTKALQAAITNAAAGDTIVLPSGVCVLAKCDVVALGHVCYGPEGL